MANGYVYCSPRDPARPMGAGSVLHWCTPVPLNEYAIRVICFFIATKYVLGVVLAVITVLLLCLKQSLHAYVAAYLYTTLHR